MLTNKKSEVTNPLRSKIQPAVKLSEYQLTTQQYDIISWCVAKTFKKRLSNGETIPSEYVAPSNGVFPES